MDEITDLRSWFMRTDAKRPSLNTQGCGNAFGAQKLTKTELRLYI